MEANKIKCINPKTASQLGISMDTVLFRKYSLVVGIHYYADNEAPIITEWAFKTSPFLKKHFKKL
jgi:hypothetical protein